MVAFLEDLRSQIKTAVESVLHAKVDYLVMGMSAETFWGGEEGAAEFVKFMGELSGGLEVSKLPPFTRLVDLEFNTENMGLFS